MSKYQNGISTELYTKFGFLRIWENKRPSWLVTDRGERLELDFYFPELQIAVEVQGMQHYQYIPHFHKDYAEFQSQIRRDQDKKTLCGKEGVVLLEVYDEASRQETMEFISSYWEKKIRLSSSDALIIKRIKKVVKDLLRWDQKNATRRIRTGFRRLQFLIEHGGYERFHMLPIDVQNAVGFFVKKYKDVVLYYPNPQPLHGKRFKMRINRARQRQALQVSEPLWCVRGGQEIHLLLVDGYQVTCDCLKSQDPVDSVCCHALLYYKTKYGSYVPDEALPFLKLPL